MIDYDGTIAAHAARSAIIPQDRQREALVMNWSLVENTLLGRQHRAEARRGLELDRARARSRRARDSRASRHSRRPRSTYWCKTLSGGNQQKLVVGRALIDRPDFVLAYNPTRGIDVGAAALVQSRLMEARNRGAAVLLISFELDEILALADARDRDVPRRGRSGVSNATRSIARRSAA